jgi:RNA polymerase sigma factor (sigma-70 family)
VFLTLSEYLLGARKILNIYGFSHHKNDEDAISFVAYYMMKADQTWDGVSSSKSTWRFNQARYAIFKLKAKHKKQKKILSLDKKINTKSTRGVCLHNIIPSPQKINICIDEILTIAKNRLSDTQYQCIFMRYVNDMKLHQISNKLGITKQAVDSSIQKALEKIRNECINKIDYITS